MFKALQGPAAWSVVLAAAGILLVTMGIRQSFGLFIQPMSQSTGLGIAALSFAMAIAQLSWGAVQPIAGALADRFGPARVLVGGLLLLAIGTALTPLLQSQWGVVLSVGLLTALGSGAAGFSVLIGAAAQRLSPEARGSASGIINAGGSLGQFVFAPLSQKLIQSIGWMGSMWALALAALATLPLIRTFGEAKTKAAQTSGGNTSAPHELSMRQALSQAFGDRSYFLLSFGFFTCGFHIAFLVTHLPGEISLCGLPADVAGWSLAIVGLANVFGSLYAGSCVAKYPSKYVLAAMYGSRALLIVLYLLAPKTALTFYLFAVGLGFTWLATVPPTAAIVGKLFGVRYLATLFGIVLFVHQIGAFFGAWLGGLALTLQGNYSWMWYADIALSALAAIANLPIHERDASATPQAA